MNSRLTKVKKLLVEQSIDALLISSVPNIIYLTGYAGFSPVEREAYLLITQNYQYLFTDLRYSEAIKELVPNFKLLEIRSQEPFLKRLEQIRTNDRLKSLGFEADNLTVAEFAKIKPLFSTHKSVELRSIREIKTPAEIEAIRRACELGDQTFAYIESKIKSGMTEKEVALAMEMYIRSNGGKLSFPTIVAFDKNSAIPHHLSNDQRLTTHDIILLDFGVEIDNYCSDMTRTAFIGKPTPEQKKVYETVLEAQEKAIEYVKNKLSLYSSSEQSESRSNEDSSRLRSNNKIETVSVDKAARRYIISHGYPSIPHSLGHGIGIEVHEAPTLSPKSNDKLEEGMVFSIEPGIYLPGKFGVRIEDLFAIQNGNLVQLTNAPKNLIAL